MIPTIQSIHIIGIGVVLGSVFMIDLRILGWAGTDQTLRQTTSRFGPWLTGALCLQLATGILMVIGEPVRELVNFSFWLKMFLVAVGTLIAAIFLITLPKHQQQWDETLVNRRSIKSLAILTFLIWLCIIILGRLIAYDHVWGSWSPAPKA
jgi:heme A synthase